MSGSTESTQSPWLQGRRPLLAAALLIAILAAPLVTMAEQLIMFPALKPVRIAPGVVEGTVVDVDGKTPLRKAKIQVFTKADNKKVAEVQTDKFGKYKLPKLEPGNYMVQVGPQKVEFIVAEGVPQQALKMVLPNIVRLPAAPIKVSPGFVHGQVFHVDGRTAVSDFEMVLLSLPSMKPLNTFATNGKGYYKIPQEALQGLFDFGIQIGTGVVQFEVDKTLTQRQIHLIVPAIWFTPIEKVWTGWQYVAYGTGAVVVVGGVIIGILLLTDPDIFDDDDDDDDPVSPS